MLIVAVVLKTASNNDESAMPTEGRFLGPARKVKYLKSAEFRMAQCLSIAAVVTLQNCRTFSTRHPLDRLGLFFTTPYSAR